MFSKGSEKLESLIGQNAHFEGEVKTKGTLKVDGKMKGNIEADWVIITEKAIHAGNVNARGIDVGGTVEGNIKAKEMVHIKQKGVVKGDITTKSLTVDEGGIIDGRTIMIHQQEGGATKTVEVPNNSQNTPKEENEKK